jgi:alkanesulfonate monooxygenase SsuD/methylene tetrahydromethanopterin reductase-like flavin-dependent oxidoreductase (luciferase family)
VLDFLDAFALIGTLIGQTSQIRFLTDVADLPPRPPQMLAGASASLDLLSGGRFNLGLGAGRAWPQIAGQVARLAHLNARDTTFAYAC